MILTGNQIVADVKKGGIYISPYDEECIEPNSYGFHLNNDLIEYDLTNSDCIDIRKEPKYTKMIIDSEGFTLLPKRIYLGSTYEIMGSELYAQTLHARFSTASSGIWIQFSAPLGHIGAIIKWTLEIMVAGSVIIYPYMPIGKIAFWSSLGEKIRYDGRYTHSNQSVISRLALDFNTGG
jgi:dCTP deaminase